MVRCTRLPGPRRHARARIAATAALLLAACDRGPVEWRAELERHPLPGDASAALHFDSTGAVAPRAADAIVPPLDYAGRACPGSMRFASARDARGRTLTAAVWWSVRPDSSARLVSAVTADAGATWTAAVPVDSLDRSGRGCARPAPAVAFEPRTGYVHVAYFLEAVEGPGIFFAHSMDEGQLFHAPVPIVYGERPADVAIAATGDTVAIAYEDPNARQPMIGLALSRTQGHIFERRAVTASPTAARATDPVVWVRGPALRVGWIERSEGAPAAFVVRHGRVKAGALDGG